MPANLIWAIILGLLGERAGWSKTKVRLMGLFMIFGPVLIVGVIFVLAYISNNFGKH